MAFQDFQSDFTPAVDIGWRLKKTAWVKGYVTEGATRCLEFAFNELNLDKTIATCTKKNLKSEKVMQKIEMQKIGEFNHPRLNDFPQHEKCICCEITKQMWQ